MLWKKSWVRLISRLDSKFKKKAKKKRCITPCATSAPVLLQFLVAICSGVTWLLTVRWCVTRRVRLACSNFNSRELVLHLHYTGSWILLQSFWSASVSLISLQLCNYPTALVIWSSRLNLSCNILYRGFEGMQSSLGMVIEVLQQISCGMLLMTRKGVFGGGMWMKRTIWEQL